MSIESILKSRTAVLAILAVTIAVAAAGRRAYGEEPITLQQPTTTLVVKASAERSPLRRNESSIMRKESSQRVAMLQPTPPVAPTAPVVPASPPAAPVVNQPAAMQPAGVGAPFTPHYLCLCPPYCGKPMPCVDCCYKCCPDCYCSKPMPCPNPCYNCTCDDYCAKPMPCNFPKPLCGPCGPCRKSEPCPLYTPWPARGPCITH
ncbi:hypothetical protein [Lacipirellula sp.]|uniref:hypothetical protein n=1 Tax=Lacipirellula sp. TaxID=2691419 RepID=UPI003D0BE47C